MATRYDYPHDPRPRRDADEEALAPVVQPDRPAQAGGGEQVVEVDAVRVVRFRGISVHSGSLRAIRCGGAAGGGDPGRGPAKPVPDNYPPQCYFLRVIS